MDNILEILVPLIFAAIYFFGNMFSGKKEDESAPAPRRGNEAQEADAIERQRRIQEEIRRKIMERRREASGSTSPLEPAEGRAQERELQKQGSAGASRSASAEDSSAESSLGRRDSFSWGSSDNAYESEMQERLQQIEATQRQAEKLKQLAGQTVASASSRPQSSSRRSSLSKDPVRKSLRDPAAARAAFIYAEVLGQPITQRKQSSVPGLSN